MTTPSDPYYWLRDDQFDVPDYFYRKSLDDRAVEVERLVEAAKFEESLKEIYNDIPWKWWQWQRWLRRKPLKKFYELIRLSHINVRYEGHNYGYTARISELADKREEEWIKDRMRYELFNSIMKKIEEDENGH